LSVRVNFIEWLFISGAVLLICGYDTYAIIFFCISLLAAPVRFALELQCEKDKQQLSDASSENTAHQFNRFTTALSRIVDD
jgi:hypothetical protein